MSKNLQSRGPVKLTQFAGPTAEAVNGDRRKLQLTTKMRWFTMTRDDARALRDDLNDWLEDRLEEDFDN
jgi:hypothetical protein